MVVLVGAIFSWLGRLRMALERELKTYNDQLTNLLPNEGKFVLVHDSDVVGIYDTYEDALKTGYEKYGLAPFLVKKIQTVEQVQYFTRDLCHT